MSFSTIAATRQKEMKASMALDATNTRAEGVMPLELEPSCEACIGLGRTSARALPSAFARLAVGLGLKGVLPCAGWAGLTDSPRRNSAPQNAKTGRSRDPDIPLRVPRSRQVAGFNVELILMPKYLRRKRREMVEGV